MSQANSNFLHQHPVLPEDLDAAVAAVAGVEKAVVCEAYAVDVVELLDAGLAGGRPIRSPMALAGTGIGIHDEPRSPPLKERSHDPVLQGLKCYGPDMFSAPAGLAHGGVYIDLYIDDCCL